MMNTLFRDIKENRNLDVEESDDEEEFENISLDKFVNLDKKYIVNVYITLNLNYLAPIRSC